MAGWLVARWFLGGEVVGGEIPWWRDDRIPMRGFVFGSVLKQEKKAIRACE